MHPAAPAASADTTTGWNLHSAAERRAAPDELIDRFGTLVAVGSGAMGRVYRGYDAVRGVDVAVKVLVEHSPAMAARLRREAQLLSRLAHPNLCGVLEWGERDGQPFLVMPYIEGRSLDRVVPELSLLERLRLFRSICAGVNAAHAAGLIHRDIKPGNILVRESETGELHACVMDFGIARDNLDSNLTATGEVLGTPAYMAPEQARGDSQFADQRCDVWALGAILFELLTGRVPFPGRSASEVMARILDSDAPSPRSVDRRVPKPLARICLQCLERDPHRRYPNVSELVLDVEAYLAGHSVRARAIGLGFSLRRIWRRQPGLWSAVGILALTLAGSAMYSMWLRIDSAQRARSAAELAQMVENVKNRMRIAYLSPPADLDRVRIPLRIDLQRLDLQRNAADAERRNQIERSLAQAWEALDDDARAAGYYMALRTSGAADRADLLGLARVMMRQYLAVRRPVADLPALEQASLLAQANLRWLEPARAALRDADALSTKPTAEHVEMDLLEGRIDQADRRMTALETSGEAPESGLRLRGELEFARGESAMGKGAVDAARSALDAAHVHFAAAAAITRSDPQILTAACLNTAALIRLGRSAGVAPAMTPEQADPHCAQLQVVDAQSPTTAEALATVWNEIAQAHAIRNEPDQAKAARVAMQSLAARALEGDPERLMARVLLADALAAATRSGVKEYEPARAAIDAAIAQYELLVKAAPGFVPGRIGLGKVLRSRGRLEQNYQKDPREDYARAASVLEAVLSLRPESVEAHDALSLTHVFWFYYWRDHDAQQAVQHATAAIAQVDTVLSLQPENPDALYSQGANRGDLWVFQAYASSAKEFPATLAELDRALDYLATLRRVAAERPEGYGHALGLLMTGAERARQLGLQATPLLERAQALLQVALAQSIALDRNVEAWYFNERAMDLARQGSVKASAAFDEADQWLRRNQAADDPQLQYSAWRQRIVWAAAKAQWQRSLGRDPVKSLSAGDAAVAQAQSFEQAAEDTMVLCPAGDLAWERAQQLGVDSAAGKKAVQQALDQLNHCTTDEPVSARPWHALRDKLRKMAAADLAVDRSLATQAPD